MFAHTFRGIAFACCTICSTYAATPLFQQQMESEARSLYQTHASLTGGYAGIATTLPTNPEVKITAKETPPHEPLTLWYKEPATNWVTQALPIGGGDFGAMIFGGIAQDRIQFNHKTLWKGSAKTGDLGSYLNFGELYIINKESAPASDYQRSLNLKEAIAQVEYTQNGIDFRKEYLASHPNKVIAIHYTASKGHPLNLELQLIHVQGDGTSYSNEGAVFSGQLANGLHYRAQMSVEQKGGKVTATTSGIQISDARELILYLACDTDFDPLAPSHMTGNTQELESRIQQRLTDAQKMGYNRIRRKHIDDYTALLNRVDFSLKQADFKAPTLTLLEEQHKNASYSAALDMLAFQYGRYLTIASSRGVALPSNLQGIWNKDGNATQDAVWASDIHANINVQMNYWPAEPTNLSECHLPFLQYIYNEAMRPNGTWQQNARDLGVRSGWVVHTAGNIFGGASLYKAGKYSVANAWFCEHLWQHFLYTCDTTFLRQTALPVMKSTCEFWFERLVEAADGTLECPYEYSPEQGRIQNATAHGQQLVTQLFLNTLDALDAAGETENDAFRQTLKEKLAHIDRGLRVNSKGELREWKYQENTPNQPANQNHFANDEANVWQGHRHTSHLVALYPGFEIDPGKNDTIFKAAVQSLKDRGETGTGWALAWRIALWSRARNAQKAYTFLRKFTTHTDALSYNWYGGLYDNMLDAHATSVFQIEGNFGATAGMAEMLLQSRPDSMVLLPALPQAWSEGSIKGLKAIGNFELDLEWKNHQLCRLHLRSGSGKPAVLAYPGIENARIKENGKRFKGQKECGKNRLILETEAGKEYVLTWEGKQKP